MKRRVRFILFSMLLSVVLAACGGGGGGGGGGGETPPVNEAPVITSTDTTPAVNENSTAVTMVTATDADGTTPTYKIAGGADSALFTIDAASGALSFKIAPDYETLVPNPVEVQVAATDGTLDSAAQTISVIVLNVNDAPVITSSDTTPRVDENTTAVSTITATDDDGTTPTYKIVGGVDSALFTIDEFSGALSFISAPNYEALTKNPLEVQVAANDGPLDSAPQAVSVTVLNVNEAPVITSSDTTPSVDENTTAVTTITATDIDGTTPTYKIVGGADSGLFSVDEDSGVLSFVAAPNYEALTKNPLEVQVAATDGTLDSATQAISVTVLNVNDAPVITSSDTTPSVDENTTAVSTITATDDDGTTPTYKIVDGVDSALFTIDEFNGALSFISAPNYEALTKNPLEVQVAATDGTLDSAAQMIVVTVNNVNESPPVFTSGDFIVAENTLTAGTVIASDGDGVSPTYVISGGIDQSLFSLNETSGELTFKNNPNYESPADDGGDNIYNLKITASSEGDSVDQVITVTVTSVEEPPQFTSSNATSVAENTSAGTIFHVVLATDQDIGSTVSYSISGVDSALFNFDTTTGQLSFKIVPDYEAPVSGSGTNDYVVVVSATDSHTAPVFQTLTVSVSNVFDPPVAASLSVSASAKQLHFSWTDPASISFARLYKNPDISSGFTQLGGDIPAGTETAADNIAVHQEDWPKAQYLLEVCNQSGECNESAPIDVNSYMLDAIGYVKASDTTAYNEFGWSVVISDDGSTLAIGSRNNNSNAGAVYLYSKDAGGEWSFNTKLVGDNTEAGDKFAHSVALSDDGNTLAVGTIEEDGVANGTSNSGAVYIFTRSGGSWSQQAYLKASNADVDDQFGQAVSLSNNGNTLAVGAHQEDSNAIGVDTVASGDNSLGDSGAVYIFTRSGSAWSPHSYIKASTPGADDWFGSSISLGGDADTLAVGAYQEDSSTNTIGGSDAADVSPTDDYGAVYIFSWDGSAWSQQEYIKAANAGKGDQFGISVSLSDSGNILAVGADEEDGGTNGIDDCGTSDVDCVSNSGAAYIFTRSGDWTQAAYLKASNADAVDVFGASVSLSGDGSLLAVSAKFDDSNATGVNGDNIDNSVLQSGAVFTFAKIVGIWTEQAYVKASNTDASDNFGHALSMNNDGTALAISATGEDSKATNVGGNRVHDCNTTLTNCAKRSGAVYLY